MFTEASLIPVDRSLEVRGEQDVASLAGDGGGGEAEGGAERVHEDGAADVDGAQDGQARVFVEHEDAAGGKQTTTVYSNSLFFVDLYQGW